MLVTFAFVFVFVVTLLLRLSLWFALELLVLVFDPRLASAITMTISPAPIISTAAKPPRIHQIAFDFLRGGGADGGIGDHCGGGGGGCTVGLGLTTADSGR